MSNRAKTLRSNIAFWTRFSFCPPGAAVFPRKLAGYLVTTRPSPGNRVHIPRDGPGSRQHGGARHLLGLFTKRVSHFSVADSAPALYWDFEVSPGGEGELFEPTVSLGRPRGLAAPRSILWAAGRKNPLLASCEKEIQELLDFMKRKKTLATTEEQKYEFHRLW